MIYFLCLFFMFCDIDKDYFSSLSFFDSFILEFISVVFLHIVKRINESSKLSLAITFPSINCAKKPTKLIEISENDDNVMYNAMIIYSIFSIVSNIIFLNVKKS